MERSGGVGTFSWRWGLGGFWLGGGVIFSWLWGGVVWPGKVLDVEQSGEPGGG